MASGESEKGTWLGLCRGEEGDVSVARDLLEHALRGLDAEGGVDEAWIRQAEGWLEELNRNEG